MKKGLITVKVTTHFFIRLFESMTSTLSTRPTADSRLKSILHSIETNEYNGQSRVNPEGLKWDCAWRFVVECLQPISPASVRNAISANLPLGPVMKVVGVYKETGSGTKLTRAERKKVMVLAQSRQIDAVLVTELSRWGRPTVDLLSTLRDLESWEGLGGHDERDDLRSVHLAWTHAGNVPLRHCGV